MNALPQTESPKEKVGYFMTTPVKSVDVNATIQEAAGQMDSKNISALITTENEKHVGIVTERDFTRKVVTK
jgi:signal-transduction protein with cAMP-binding, CBS, and nucleotidyltransferase domain